MKKVIMNLEEKRVRALLERDIEDLDQMIAEEFIHTESNGKLRTKAEFIANFRDREFEFVSFVIEKNTIRIYGNTAVVSGIYNNRVQYGGRLMPLKRARHLRVYVKNKGRWLLVAHQATAIAHQ